MYTLFGVARLTENGHGTRTLAVRISVPLAYAAVIKMKINEIMPNASHFRPFSRIENFIYNTGIAQNNRVIKEIITFLPDLLSGFGFSALAFAFRGFGGRSFLCAFSLPESQI